MIVAALAWYAETAESLERCARSLGGFCDTLVAIGGRWDGFPAVDGDDPAAQARAIERGADEAGIFCDVTWTAETFASQVEKRAELMAAARSVGDFVFVIDGDEYIVDAHTDEVIGLLERTEADAAQVAGIRVPLSASSARRPWRRMYRSSTGVTVETAHNGYRAADGRWLYGDPAHVTLEPVLDLSAHVLIAHDIAARSGERKIARKSYLRDRRDRQTERWPERVVA